MIKKYLLILILVLVLQATISSCQTQNKTIIKEKEMLSQINQIVDVSKILSSMEVDRLSCGEHSQPGLAVDDFDGNGLKDYALLVKKSNRNMDKEQFEIGFEIYLQQKKNQFVRVQIDTFTKQVPFDIFITSIWPKKYLSNIIVKQYDLRLPAVMLVECRESDTVFYWNKSMNKFEKIIVED